VDALALFAAAPLALRDAGPVLRRGLGLTFGGAAALGACALVAALPARAALAAVLLAAFAYGARRWLVTPDERAAAAAWIRRRAAAAPAAAADPA
jgi:hypothetical protein